MIIRTLSLTHAVHLEEHASLHGRHQNEVIIPLSETLTEQWHHGQEFIGRIPNGVLHCL